MGTHLRELNESFPINPNMARVQIVFKNLSVLVFLTKVVPALDGLSAFLSVLITCLPIKSIPVSQPGQGCYLDRCGTRSSLDGWRRCRPPRQWLTLCGRWPPSDRLPRSRQPRVGEQTSATRRHRNHTSRHFDRTEPLKSTQEM